jgi:nucleotide-binding universal stress UspA family protein
MVRGLGSLAGGAVAIELIDGGVGQALVDWIGRRRPDLVVMATHGRGALSRFWLGSVADHVIRHAAAPVLLIRPRDSDAGERHEYPLTSGIVALDRSEDSLAILEPAIELALATQARLTLLTVVEPILGVESMPPYPVAVPEGLLESLRAEAQAELAAAAERVRSRGLAVATKVVVKTGVAAAILDELDEGGADFVAVSTHAAGELKRVLVGSVADKVVRAATTPVLVVRREPR